MTLRRAAAAIAAATAIVAGCEPRPPGPPAVVATPASFAELPGWAADDQGAALDAFVASCRRGNAASVARPPDLPGEVAWPVDWSGLCAAAASTPKAAARAFFEQWFQPFALGYEGQQEGLFTGYYEPLLQGSRRMEGPYRHPLYRRPGDLVTVDLSAFDLGRGPLAGRIAGRVENGRLVPYPDRAAIEAGTLVGRGLELLWVDDPVALFFLQIQGSGQVQLTSGERIRVGYAEQNGRPYRAIGRDLVEAGELAADDVSLQTIQAWLRRHPDRAAGMMAKNPAYVFFRELGPVDPAQGPPGAEGVPLTPGRSLAVDRRYVAFGTPIWLDTTAPFPEAPRTLRRLMIAQDIGGAIKGPARGDVFWGAGELAEYVAGHMKSRGRWYILLPRTVRPVS